MRFPKRSKRAAVLGCGPAGLFATHALIEKGWGVTIYSKRRKSEMFGAQYLHAPIPGLSDGEPRLVNYQLNGTVQEYREKVYGVNPVWTSVEALGHEHAAWDIREAYDNAWSRYAPLICDQEVTPQFLGLSVIQTRQPISEMEPISLDLRQFDVVVNSIPLDSLCYQRDAHQFHSASVWAMGDAPERGISAPVFLAPFTVQCDGTRDRGWYRAANVYGYKTVEWPGSSRPPLPGVAQVIKPIDTTCDCYHNMPYRFVRVGRYGRWMKGVLSHQAYEQMGELR
jgi:hypothetical protein